jgi:hypothetical protein
VKCVVLKDPIATDHAARRGVHRCAGPGNRRGAGPCAREGRHAHSKAAQELFGAPFVSHFAASREREEREFRRAVTDWELARYFEII